MDLDPLLRQEFGDTGRQALQETDTTGPGADDHEYDGFFPRAGHLAR
jgi:hypothetical protein